MIRCITFDLDDTLWACTPVIARAEQRFYDWLDQHYPRITERYSYEAMIDDRIAYMRDYPELHHHLTRLRKQWLHKLATEAGYDDALVEPGFRVFWLARNEVVPFREALDALETLGSLYRIGAITNGNADVHHIGIGHHFDFVVRSEEAGASKPHPDIFRQALAQAGAVGLRTVWVNAEGGPWPLETAGPDITIRGLDELERALDFF